MENSFGLSRMKFFHHTGFQARKRVLGAMLKDFRHRNAVCLNKTDRFRFCLNKNKVTGFIVARDYRTFPRCAVLGQSGFGGNLSGLNRTNGFSFKA